MNVEPCWEAWRLAITIIMIVIFNWTSMSFKIMWVQPYKAKNKKYLCTKVVRSTGKDVDTPEPIRNNPFASDLAHDAIIAPLKDTAWYVAILPCSLLAFLDEFPSRHCCWSMMLNPQPSTLARSQDLSLRPSSLIIHKAGMSRAPINHPICRFLLFSLCS